MDPTWLSVALILLLLFSFISLTGALRRIADATEKSAKALESLIASREKTRDGVSGDQ